MHVLLVPGSDFGGEESFHFRNDNLTSLAVVLLSFLYREFSAFIRFLAARSTAPPLFPVTPLGITFLSHNVERLSPTHCYDLSGQMKRKVEGGPSFMYKGTF